MPNSAYSDPPTQGAASTPATQAAQPAIPRPNESPAEAAAREFLTSQGREPAAVPEPKPTVLVPGGRISNTESAKSLFEAIAPKKELFYRGGAVVELVNEGNGYSIEVLKPVAAQSRFEKYVEFFKPGKTPTDPATRTTISKAQAEVYLNSEECRKLLPKMNGILRCSLLVEKDGQLRSLGNGYDEETGYFVDGAQTPAEVGLDQAVEFLTGLLDEFDFLTPGDRSRAIASMLTPALKLSKLIKGPVPVDVAEANASQSGKTYRQKMVAALYNQNIAVVTKKSGGVGSMEETFSDHLVKSRTFIQFDNVRGKLDSQFLESFFTADNGFPARTAYQSQIMVDPGQFIIFISSNGFEAPRDLTNRASIIRIKKREGHQFRQQDGKDDLQMTFELQFVWYGAVLTVIKEWHRRGKPRTNDMRHDMREWCQTLDWIVQNIFHAAPLMDDHEEAKERAANPNLTFLRTLAIAVSEDHQFGQSLTATQLVNFCIEKELEIPGLSEDKQADVDAGRKQMGTIMGRLFGAKSEVKVEGFMVTKGEEIAHTDQGNPQTLKRYTFGLVPKPAPPNPATIPAQPVSAPIPAHQVETAKPNIPRSP